jgi:hypothetical protein
MLIINEPSSEKGKRRKNFRKWGVAFNPPTPNPPEKKSSSSMTA